jgi:hypothetical protein
MPAAVTRWVATRRGAFPASTLFTSSLGLLLSSGGRYADANRIYTHALESAGTLVTSRDRQAVLLLRARLRKKIGKLGLAEEDFVNIGPVPDPAMRASVLRGLLFTQLDQDRSPAALDVTARALARLREHPRSASDRFRAAHIARDLIWYHCKRERLKDAEREARRSTAGFSRLCRAADRNLVAAAERQRAWTLRDLSWILRRAAVGMAKKKRANGFSRNGSGCNTPIGHA